MPINVTPTGEWAKASAVLGAAPSKIRLALDRAVLQEAQFFRKKVVEGFRDQAPGGQQFEPLADTTLAIRRFEGHSGTKALIRNADLRNSVKVVKETTPVGTQAFVGVLRSAKAKDGEDLVNIAEIHEFGAGPYVVNVTPAMRRFLMTAFSQELPSMDGGEDTGTMRRGFLVIKIPARPFIQPVADRWFSGADAAARFQGRVATNLGGIMGAFGATGGRSRRSAIIASHKLAPGSGR